MSTGLILLGEAQTLTEDDKIKSANGVIWINEFIDILGSNAMIYSSYDYVDSIAKIWYDLPATCNDIYMVDEYLNSSMLDSDFQYEYIRYHVLNNRIKFSDDGNYRIHYFTNPIKILAVTDEVDIDDSFYLPLKLYVAYRQLTFDDADNAAPNTLGRERYLQFQQSLSISVDNRKKKFKKKYRIRRS